MTNQLRSLNEKVSAFLAAIRQDASESEIRSQRSYFQAFLWAMVVLFSFMGAVILPLRYGNQAWSSVQFTYVCILLASFLVAHFVSRGPYQRRAAFLPALAFLAISAEASFNPVTIAATPFVPFYTATIGIILAGVFLALRPLSLYLLLTMAVLTISMLFGELSLLDYFHRSVIILVTAPSMLGMAYMRHQSHYKFEQTVLRLLTHEQDLGAKRLNRSIELSVQHPVSIISGYSHSLLHQSRTGILSESEMAQGLDRIRDTSNRLQRTLAQWATDHASLGSSQNPTTDLRSLIKHCLHSVQQQIDHPDKIAITARSPEIPVWVKGELLQLLPAIDAILLNAIEAVHDQAKPAIEIVIQIKADMAQLLVYDSGPGVPKHLHKRIMLPFFSTKNPQEHYGLGLVLCKRALEANGGSLQLLSLNEGERTCFCLTFPIQESAGQGKGDFPLA